MLMLDVLIVNHLPIHSYSIYITIIIDIYLTHPLLQTVYHKYIRYGENIPYNIFFMTNTEVNALMLLFKTCRIKG